MKIILGSQSKWRKGILEGMGYKFDVMSPDIDEKAIRDDDPNELTLKLARAKAEALLPRIKDEVILITSDQVVVCNGEVREKPESEEQAREYLKSYAKYPIETVTAVFAINTKTGKRAEGVDVVSLHFAPIPEDVIEKLISSGDIFTCAGGFSLEIAVLENLLGQIDGERESVIGMPKTLTERLIKEVS